jgi:peptidoglycan/LPS O-acetylase OafA/YrhL
MNESPTPALSGSRHHLPLLDGVRGCAILLVLATHVVGGVAPANRFDIVVLRALRAGWIGVDLFFVLSGFLITGILLDSRGDRRYFVAFFARRALRILPLYWLFLILLAAYAGFFQSGSEWDALMASMPWHIAYLTNVLVAMHGWNAAALQSGHLWSLAVEEQFYLVWPFIVLAASARQLRERLRRLLVYLPALRGLALASGLFAVTVHVLTPFRADALGVGALLALAVRDREREALLRRLRVAARVAAAALLIIVVSIGSLPYTSAWVQTIGYTALALVSGAIVERALRPRAGSIFDRTLGSRPLRSFGRYSYSIYLFHAPVLLALHGFVVDRTDLPVVAGSRIPALAVYASCFAALMWLIGFTTWWTFERHFIALKRYFAYSTESTAPPIPVAARAA